MAMSHDVIDGRVITISAVIDTGDPPWVGRTDEGDCEHQKHHRTK